MLRQRSAGVWLSDALLWVAAVLAVTVTFAITPLDIEAARLFYNPLGPDHWPLAAQLPWSILYRSAPPIAALLLCIGLLALIAGRLRRNDRLLVHGAFLLHVGGELHGFGFPGSVLDATMDSQDAGHGVLRFQIKQHGWITDLDSSATIRVPPADLQQIVVRLQHGDIRITDATRARVVAAGRLHLDLGTKVGHVQSAAGIAP